MSGVRQIFPALHFLGLNARPNLTFCLGRKEIMTSVHFFFFTFFFLNFDTVLTNSTTERHIDRGYLNAMV